MPICLSKNTPSFGELSKCFPKDFFWGNSFKKRGAIVNLMPNKEETEKDFLLLLKDIDCTIQLDFIRMESHISKNCSQDYLNQYYTSFKKARKKGYDFIIITGAPVETLSFEEVSYWSELKEIWDWSYKNQTPTLNICWAAPAAMYYYYDIEKYTLSKKLSGIFDLHTATDHPLFCNTEKICMPHSRHTSISMEQIYQNNNLDVIAWSNDTEAAVVEDAKNCRLFVTGHWEYNRWTLHNEYQRDKERGLSPNKPQHYYSKEDEDSIPQYRWNRDAKHFIQNWFNLYIKNNKNRLIRVQYNRLQPF